jgi:hypothetical protein
MGGLASFDGRVRVAVMILVLASGSCTSAVAPSMASPSIAVSPPATGVEVTPSPTEGLSATWTRVADQPALRVVQLSRVVWTGTRFVATGSGGQFLDSLDGRTWHLQEASWPEGQVWGIAVGTRGVVAVGQLNTRAASWYSTDGLKWTIGPDEETLHAAADAQIRMRGVVETADGWLAVGDEDEPCQVVCPAAARAVVWRSSDGMRWEQEPAVAALEGAVMTGLTPGGPGYVAVGQSVPFPSAGVVWTSPTGVEWSRVDDAPVFHAPPGTDQTFGAAIHGVATGSDGVLVAVGSVATQGEQGSALAWWSTDGRTWSAATGERFLYGQLFSVAATPSGFLATGPSGTASCQGGIWFSSDGASWSCVADGQQFLDFAAYAAAGSDDVEVVVGFGPPYTLPGGGPAASVWTRPIP